MFAFKFQLFSFIILLQVFSFPVKATIANLIDQIPDDKQRVDSILANFYTIYSANIDDAIAVTQNVYQLSVKNNWQDKQAYALMYNGIAHCLRGNYEKSLQSLLAASEIFDKLNDKDGIARLNNELSVTYRHQKNMSRANQALDKAEKAAREVNNLEQLGTNYGMRGTILSRKGNLDSAQTYFDKVLQIRLQLKDSVGLGYVYLDFAKYAFSKGYIDSSDMYIAKSTIIRERLGDLQGVAENEQLVGRNFFYLNEYPKAIEHFRKSINIATPIGYTWLIRHNHEWLQKCYATLSDFEAAYFHQSVARVLNDSLFNIDKSKAIEELQTKYETEKKDQAIVVLNQENQLQKATNERNNIVIISLIIGVLFLILIFYLWRQRVRIRQQQVLDEQKIKMREVQLKAVIDSEEKERRRFAADIHDSMGQMITSLNMNILSLKSQPQDKDVRDEIFSNATSLATDIQKEIRNIAFNLMPITLTKEGLAPALKELLARINKSHKVLAQLAVHGVDQRLSEVYEISMYRILQEWISNVLKYANATTIYIQIITHKHEILVTVEDNGMGFNFEDFKNSKGNGWTNMNSRLDLINGSMEMDTAVGRPNTMLTITLNKTNAFIEENLVAN